jgi:acyl-CoA dehydrogenase
VIDFTPTPEAAQLAERTAAFVRDVVIPAEPRDLPGHGLDAGLRAELQAAARSAGLFARQVAVQHGGLGLDVRGQSAVFEEAGYSILGPQARNCAAPDEGNMHLLSVIATPEQRERYLGPLAAGEVRSCFAMTEPSPGAGSDPAMLATTAVTVDGGWSISGRKWFVTGAEGAGFAICMARTASAIESGRGATMFLIDESNPGWRVERVIEAIDRSFPGGHAEVLFEECVVGPEAVVGQVGEGYRYAQVRLAPARLTHCMRWLGLAGRAHEITVDRANEREAFGQRLGELGMVQGLIADSRAVVCSGRICSLNLGEGDRPLRCRPVPPNHPFVAIGIASSGRVGTIALQECDRHAAGAVWRSRTAEFGRNQEPREFARSPESRKRRPGGA